MLPGACLAFSHALPPLSDVVPNQRAFSGCLAGVLTDKCGLAPSPDEDADLPSWMQDFERVKGAAAKLHGLLEMRVFRSSEARIGKVTLRSL